MHYNCLVTILYIDQFGIVLGNISILTSLAIRIPGLAIRIPVWQLEYQLYSRGNINCLKINIVLVSICTTYFFKALEWIIYHCSHKLLASYHDLMYVFFNKSVFLALIWSRIWWCLKYIYNWLLSYKLQTYKRQAHGL